MARPRARLQTRRPDHLPDGEASARAAALLRVQTLGATRIVVGDLAVDPSYGTLFSLLVRLAYAPAFTVSRDELLRQLWPGQTDVRQRGNLRQSLYKLRSMGVQATLAGRAVQLDPLQVEPTFSIERSAALFERDVIRGNEPFGVFLPSVQTPLWAEYQDWLDATRETVHADVRRVLVEQLRARRARADWGGAETHARWLLQFDPLNEDATLILAECTMVAGAKVEAIEILDRYLAELGPNAGEIRLPAAQLRKRFTEPPARGRSAIAPTERHFVGREEELAELTLAMRRARWHDGSAVLLYGPPGIGKTRLTMELAKVATIEGFRQIDLVCRESDYNSQFAVIAEVIPHLLEQPGALGCAPEHLAIIRQSFNAALPAEVEIPQRDLEQISRSLPSAAEARAAVADLILALSEERPVFLVIDDAHWLDTSTWELVIELVDRINKSRVFCLLTSHESTVRKDGASYLPYELFVRRLTALSSSACVRLARAIASDYAAPIDDELAEWFAEASEGGPLFLRSLVHHWIETGEAEGVPEGIRNVLTRRLASLDPDGLRIVQTVALIGSEVSSHTLRQILEFETHRLMDALEKLSKSGALRETVTGVEIHQLLATTALAQMPAVLRRALQQRIGIVLAEAFWTTQSDLELPTVKALIDAGDTRLTATFSIEAVKALLLKGEPHRAVAICDTALAWVGNEVQHSELAALQREALFRSGNYARVLQDPLYASRRVQSDLDWDLQNADKVLQIIEAAEYSSNSSDFDELAARALHIGESSAVSIPIRVRACLTAIRTAGSSLSEWHAHRAYQQAKQLVLDPTAPQSSRFELEMYFNTVFGSISEAREAALLLEREASLTKSADVSIKLLADVGYALRICGELGRAKTLFERVVAGATELRMYPRAVTVAAYRSSIARDHDRDPDEALRWFNHIRKFWSSTSDNFVRYAYHSHGARLAILDGDSELARRHLADSVVDQKGHSKRDSYGRSLQLGVALLDGDIDTLEALTPAALHYFNSTKYHLGQDFAVHQLCESLVRLGQSDAARTVFMSYMSASRRDQSPLPWYVTKPQ